MLGVSLGVTQIINHISSMKREYEAYLATKPEKPKSFKVYHKAYFDEAERVRRHKEALEIAEAGRPRNFWGF